MPESSVQSTPKESKPASARVGGPQFDAGGATFADMGLAGRRAQIDTSRLSADDVSALQRSMGNQQVAMMLGRGGAPTDRALVQRAPKVGLAGGPVDSDMERSIQSAKHGGTSLSPSMRRQIEPNVGADLSGVKVHTGSKAAQLSRDLGAKAFTHKQHIFFGAGQSPNNLSLTAHEATHVVQQGAAGKLAQRQVSTQHAKRDLDTSAIQRDVMSHDTFKTGTSTRRRGGFISDVDKALKNYHKRKTPATLTALRFALEKYLATKTDQTSEKANMARVLLAQVMEEENKLKPTDQLEGLLPYRAQIDALAEKSKVLKKIDEKFAGGNRDLREQLKKAVLESSKTPQALDGKVAALDLSRGTQGVQKLIQELSKGRKPRDVAIYHSIYTRCMEMTSVISEGVEWWRDYLKTLGDNQPLKDLVTAMIPVTQIFSTSLDVAYHQTQVRQHTAAQDELKYAGKQALNVVVMGAGPVGLIAAIEAYMAGANVNVYELRRSDPNRANVLKLYPSVVHKLRRMGVYSELFGPDSPKGSDSIAKGQGISVAELEKGLRDKAERLGIKITYGYGLDTITAPDQEGGKTQIRLKKYVPTRPGPEMDLYKSLEDQPAYIEATTDLVIGATGAGGTTRQKLGLESERRSGEQGEEYIDFTAVGIFKADNGDKYPPPQDATRDKAWVVGLRTPFVDYLLTQITREQFLTFKDNKGTRDEWVAERGKNLATYTGELIKSDVFDITINQAKQFVSEQAQGVVIGDEAATPHPQTGSGFNTGVASTDLVSGLVRGLGKGNKKEAFDKYNTGIKSKTDVMVNKGTGFFKSNIEKLTKMNKLPEPKVIDSLPPVDKNLDSPELEGPESPKKMPFYTPEDIGVTEETQSQYDFAQKRTLALYGIQTGLHHGNLEEYGPEYRDPERAYEEAQRKVMALYKLSSHTDEDD